MKNYDELISAEAAAIEALEAKGEEATTEDLDSLEASLNRIDELNTEKARAEELQARKSALSAARPQASKATPGAAATTIIESREVIDTLEDDGKGHFESQGHFMKAIMTSALAGEDSRRVSSLSDARLRKLAVAGQDEHQTHSDPHGGFLNPTQFSSELLELPYDDPAVMATEMAVRSIAMDSKSFEINARVDKNHSTSVSGGITVAWTAETSEIEASRQQYEQICLKANKLAGLAYVTEEQMEDSEQAMGGLLASAFQDEFRSKLMEARLNGSGIGQFEGITNSDCFIEVPAEGGQASGSIVIENLLNMEARAWRPQFWLASRTMKPQMAKLGGDSNGNGQLIWQPRLTDASPDMLLGLPIYFTDELPSIGNANDILLTNWSQYLEGTRRGPTGASSIHLRFDRDEIAFRWTMRGDGRCWWSSPMTPKNGDTLSPFVGLAARP